jgi:hypothetical protein
MVHTETSAATTVFAIGCPFRRSPGWAGHTKPAMPERRQAFHTSEPDQHIAARWPLGSIRLLKIYG